VEGPLVRRTVADRAAAYGMPGVTVDGNDLDAVHAAAVEAVDRARSGGGPTLIEAETYRWKGHSKSDKNLYRTREEIASWRERDPIAALEARVLASGVLTDDDVAAVRQEATDAVKAAVREANSAADADPGDILDAVYAATGDESPRNEARS
jgi:TPP-dependent pyruvate/acetoin dehydrogenase alpha subunit